MQTKDETQTNLINLLRKIYLTIMSSVDFEEAGHELLKIKLKPDQEMELCIMLLECCSQKRKYLRYYGLLGQVSVWSTKYIKKILKSALCSSTQWFTDLKQINWGMWQSFLLIYLVRMLYLGVFYHIYALLKRILLKYKLDLGLN